jgi:glycogen debranching enzyme
VTAGPQRYYIIAPEVRPPEHTRVLKHDETCGLFNDFIDIDATARPEEGLYHGGTRFLSRLTLMLMGGRPVLLSSAVHRDNLIWRGVCHERIHVRNFTRAPLDIALGIAFAADYADIFEPRGIRTRGRTCEQAVGGLPSVRGGFRSPHSQTGGMRPALLLPRSPSTHRIRHGSRRARSSSDRIEVNAEVSPYPG